LELKSQIQKVNAQDNFSTWARLKRTFDKKQEEFEHLKRQDVSQKWIDRFKWSLALKGIYYGITIYLFLHYRDIPVFYIPSSWIFPLNFILSYPCGYDNVISGFAWMSLCRIMLNRF
jgi:hypothetical protein